MSVCLSALSLVASDASEDGRSEDGDCGSHQNRVVPTPELWRLLGLADDLLERVLSIAPFLNPSGLGQRLEDNHMDEDRALQCTAAERRSMNRFRDESWPDDGEGEGMPTPHRCSVGALR